MRWRAAAVRSLQTRPRGNRALRHPPRSGRRRSLYLAALVVLLDSGHRGSAHRARQPASSRRRRLSPRSSSCFRIPSAFGFPPGLPIWSTCRGRSLLDVPRRPGGDHFICLPFVAIAPLACLGFSRIFPGRGRIAIGTATVFFTVNPSCYERMANGQMYVVMGYSLLPVLLALDRPAAQVVGRHGALGGLIFTLDVALSVHYLFIGGIIVIAGVTVHHALQQGRAGPGGRWDRGLCGRCSTCTGSFRQPRYRTMQSHVTDADLSSISDGGRSDLGPCGQCRRALRILAGGTTASEEPGLGLAILAPRDTRRRRSRSLRDVGGRRALRAGPSRCRGRRWLYCRWVARPWGARTYRRSVRVAFQSSSWFQGDAGIREVFRPGRPGVCDRLRSGRRGCRPGADP